MCCQTGRLLRPLLGTPQGNQKYRVNQNRIYTPYMTVYMVISLPKILYYSVYIWFWPTLQKRHLYLALILVASHCLC